MDTVMYWAADHPDVVGFAAVATIFTGLVMLLHRWQRKRTAKGEYAMQRKKRWNRLQEIYADMIHEGLFDKLHKGEITSAEYREALQYFGKRYGLEGIIRRRHHPSYIKAKVKKNVSTMKDELKLVEPSTIPGPKPGVTTPAPPLVLGANFLSRHMRKAS